MVTLLAAGADANAADAHGDTPLHKAALHNAATATALLLAHAADARAQNRFGATPLHYAAANDAVAVAALLGNAGADVNAADRHHHTPLHWAARDGAVNAADWLSRRGADAVSGWWWFYNDQGAVSWRRGKKIFDADLGEFVAREQARADAAKKNSAIKNTATGALGCAVAGAAGCGQALTNAAANLANEFARIQQWKDALAEMNQNRSVHAARFLLPPNEQSRQVTINGAQPFPRFVGKLTTAVGSCTAFMVHKKIAMTNAHCVCRDQKCKQRTPAATMKLTFARKDLTGEHDITARVKKLYADDWSAGLDGDFAFLVLQRTPDLGGHLAVAADAADTGTIATAGYPGDLLGGQVMTALWGCQLKAKANILFFASADCHNYKGASGSPYIAVDGAHRGRVVGINSFGKTGDHATGGGPASSAFYARLQQVIAAESR